ncbi:MAG: hypothetical protein LBU00_03410 [Treponema sp.]|jgi:hypothetical protein|nr:hypothetical protein [Treponema sp.]
MKRFFPVVRSLVTALGLALLCSCVGVRSEIVLNADGTGRLRLEYRVSRQFEAIGALDGNVGRPSVPLGRVDFERSIGRLEGLKLDSFSSREEGGDLVTRATISFSRLEDILPLLDSGGRGATLEREGDRRVLRIHLGGADSPGEAPDPQLLVLADQVSQGYDIAFTFSAPGGVELRVTGDSEGLNIGEPGKTTEFSVPLSRFFRPGKDLELEFVF